MIRNFILIMLIISLIGCSSFVADAPVNVRLIKTNKYALNEQGDYVPPEDEPKIRDKADLVDVAYLHLGLLFQSKNAIERFAKLEAYENDADIAVIRPHESPSGQPWQVKASTGKPWQVRVEAWRTKGYEQAIQDDVPVPGTTLIPPPGTTYTTRVRNFEQCTQEAKLASDTLTAQERLLLNGRETAAFSDFVNYPRRDRFYRPTQVGWEAMNNLDLPKHLTDRYVVCFMRRGYQWPRSADAKH